ncbi:Coiled-coil domain-containing protein 6 [Tetrabaena socialis]|uniref:Coiled-coil domain-containing protein 6 n=1 Tax=Tetrabaena socialis TaxID=47790 RepID=A0A2J7ZW86_9CHLO|nr:Coiled-coil domain-containing protein 6 [Tetrabaena socialis]|eukprot:PNH04551.1 Coiled-coil domain-containing protein 6 [Tetrabaena socialis]
MEDFSASSKDELITKLKKVSLQADYERRRADGLAEELKLAKEHTIMVQKQIEQEEEYITNKLMKRLDQLKKEKAVLASEVAQEEEFLTNTLQKRLDKLTKEKVDLENRLEAEQEYVVNKLRKSIEQLSVEKNKLMCEKVELENQLECEQEYILNRLQKQVDKLASDKLSLQKEKAELQRTVSDLGASVDKLNKDKVTLEQVMEMEEESITNKLQRRLEAVVANLRLIESRLEGKGITLKDLGITASELQHNEWPRMYSRSPSSTNTSFDRVLSTTLSAGQAPAIAGVNSGGLAITGSRRERPLSAQSNTAEGLLAK